MKTLTTSRQQRVLLRLLSCAYGTPSWVLTTELAAFHCHEEGLSAPEAVRLTEDLYLSGVVCFRVAARSGSQPYTTHVPIKVHEATGEVRAQMETLESRAAARRLREEGR